MSIRHAAAGAAAFAAFALCGCGDGGDDETTTSTTAGDQTRVEPGFRCDRGEAATAADAPGDATPLGEPTSSRTVNAPGVDFLSVELRRTGDASLCVSFRTAGPIADGGTFALETIQPAPGAPGAPYEINRYEVGLDAAGRPIVSRPAGEPRYPVPSVVGREADSVDADLLELASPLGDSFGWRAASNDGSAAEDAVPSANRDQWQLFGSNQVVGTTYFASQALDQFP